MSSLHILIHLLKGAWIYSLLEYCPSSEYPIQLMFKRKIRLPLWFLQDAFKDNFVIQWHPESLRTMKVSISRPRVYLINFETAVQFPTGCPLTERVSVGCLVAGEYFRPRAPELDSGKAYSSFKLDVWQLGYSFSILKVRHCIFLFRYSFCLLVFRSLEHSSRNWWIRGVYDWYWPRE